jgi:hypothetical protein
VVNYDVKPLADIEMPLMPAVRLNSLAPTVVLGSRRRLALLIGVSLLVT